MPQYVIDWAVLLTGYGVLWAWTEHDRRKVSKKHNTKHRRSRSNYGITRGSGERMSAPKLADGKPADAKR